MAIADTPVAFALHVIEEQLKEAMAAPKCHKCGCLHQTVEALAKTEAAKGQLAPMLALAQAVFVPKKYECLGCAVCYPAIAANAFSEIASQRIRQQACDRIAHWRLGQSLVAARDTRRSRSR